jgi:hypothetical protein
MTPQEAFDRALTGVRKQGGYSMNANSGCLYRGPLGRKCGIGQLVDDDSLVKAMDDDADDSSISSILYSRQDSERVEFPLIDKLDALFEGLDVNLLQEIQSAHDDAAQDADIGVAINKGSADDLAPFETRMRELAARWNLVYTPA